jgi:hypothetical protein
MRNRPINTIIAVATMLGLLVFASQAFPTSIHWEDITPIGDDRLVVIDKSIPLDALEKACKALPLEGYGYITLEGKSAIVMEAQRDAEWELIKDYIEAQFGD